MNQTKNHYDQHLAPIYTWMSGSVDEQKQKFFEFLTSQNIKPQLNNVAIDLGAGNGAQSFALSAKGFQVYALDFCKILVNEIKENAGEQPLQIVLGDIENFDHHIEEKSELILCWGDTLTHLPSFQDVQVVLRKTYHHLIRGGKLILSFRNYEIAREGKSRFIPVKQEDNKILTAFLEFESNHIKVYDIIHEKIKDNWQMKVSAYQKLRLKKADVIHFAKQIGYQHESESNEKDWIQLIFTK